MSLDDAALGESDNTGGPIETTTKRFRADVLEPSLRQTVLVDFWSPGCAPCKALAPVLERLVRAAKGRIRLVKMNIEEHPEVAEQLGIRSIPAVLAFQRGRASDGFVGAAPETQIRGFLERLVGPIEGGAEDIEAAQALIEAGDAAGAESLLKRLLMEEPPQARALAELLRLYLAQERIDEAEAVLAAAPDALRRDPLVLAACAALDNARAAAGLGDLEDLRRRVDANPMDWQARFDLALALNARDRREEAADQLLDIVRRARSWNEDGARKQLVQFFDAWGPADEATTAARRRLSALLFS